MLITSLLLLFPALTHSWQCGLKYNDSSVMPWVDLLPVGIDISECNISYINSNQPSYIQEIGFATHAYCFGRCKGVEAGKQCQPQAVVDVTETVTITCKRFTRQFRMTRVGGCECGIPTSADCSKKAITISNLVTPEEIADVFVFVHHCDLLQPFPLTLDVCVNNGCSGGTPNCDPVNPFNNTGPMFQCLMFNVPQTKVCTGGIMSLICPEHTVIHVLEAIYGAWEAHMTCPDAGAVVPNCQNAPVTTPIVQGLCNGRETCMIPVVNDGTLGPDSCPTVPKHLRVEHFCTIEFDDNLHCGDEFGFLACPGGQEIVVTRATWGRPYPEATCPPGGSGEPDPPCSLDVTSEIDQYCDGNNTCIGTVDYIAGAVTDPCTGSLSFLHIIYHCRPAVLTEIGCGGVYGPFSCPANPYVTFGTVRMVVFKATYGRPYAEPSCPLGGSGEPASPCSVDVTSIMKGECDGSVSCSGTVDLAADPWLTISDPCPGLNSFLEIKYSCMWTDFITLDFISYDTFDSCDCQA